MSFSRSIKFHGRELPETSQETGIFSFGTHTKSIGISCFESKNKYVKGSECFKFSNVNKLFFVIERGYLHFKEVMD